MGSVVRRATRRPGGAPREGIAERVYNQIKSFGEYGFPESHAASFALLVYVSAWLKRYHPAEFCCALLNSQPMGFYAPSQLVRDAREHDVEVRPVCANASEWDCTIEGGALRLGLRLIKDLSETDAERIAASRTDGEFESVDEFARRTGLPAAAVSRLARADASPC